MVAKEESIYERKTMEILRGFLHQKSSRQEQLTADDGMAAVEERWVFP